LNEKQRVYEMILRRPLADIRGPCALYAYTALRAAPFAWVHTADTIGALLDWLREWLQQDIADELAYDEDFWRGADVGVLAIADTDLSAFAHYALHKPIVPVYVYEHCLYLEGLLDSLPNHHFLIGWEARAPRQDIAYGIVEQIV
jgi:hypothetical protein